MSATIIQILTTNLVGKSITYFKGENGKGNIKCAHCVYDINADYDITVTTSEISEISFTNNKFILNLKNGDRLITDILDRLQIATP